MIKLQELNYDYKDLEPIIDAKTVEIHHAKHHQTYVNNLNGLIEGTNMESSSLDEILLNLDKAPADKKGGINNNAGGVYMHNVYFGQFAKDAKAISGSLKVKVEEKFSSFDEMLSILKDKALKQFGSGWSVLVVDKDGNLDIVAIPNQDVAPLLVNGQTPIATLDVWEHAYYLNYQNRRPDYLQEVVKLIDWDIVQKRYDEIVK